MTHIDSDIPQNIFYSAIKCELLRIARSALFLVDFILKSKAKNKRVAWSHKIYCTRKQDFQLSSVSSDVSIDTIINK